MLAVLKFSSFSCSFFLKIALADACLAFSQKALFVMSLPMMLSIYAGVVYIWSCIYLYLELSIYAWVYLCCLSMLSMSIYVIYLWCCLSMLESITFAESFTIFGGILLRPVGVFRNKFLIILFIFSIVAREILKFSLIASILGWFL